MAAPHDPEPGAANEHAHEVEVQVRRTPRYRVFMILGAFLGTLIAWAIAAAMGPGMDENGQAVDTNPVIGLSLVVGFVVGLGLGGLLATILDRALARRARTLAAEHVVVDEVVEAEAVEEHDEASVEGSFERVDPREQGGDGSQDEPRADGTRRTDEG